MAWWVAVEPDSEAKLDALRRSQMKPWAGWDCNCRLHTSRMRGEGTGLDLREGETPPPSLPEQGGACSFTNCRARIEDMSSANVCPKRLLGDTATGREMGTG